MRNFTDLTEREILALAISREEEDGRIYADFAEGLRDDYPASAHVFTDMAAEENEHRRRLIDLYVEKFGNHIPLVRRQDVRGWAPRRPIWHFRPLGVDVVRRQARQMEQDAARFYQQAAGRTSDAADSQVARRSCRRRSRTRESRRRRSRRAHLPDAVRDRRGRRRQAPFRPAGHSAGPGRADGRFGLDAGAGFRRRFRDA